MKTNIFKFSMIIIGLSGALNVSSQTSSQKKICISIVEIVNGKTTHIDTCFTGMSDEEVQKQLNAMGVNDIQIAKDRTASAKIIVDKVINGVDSIANRVIVINTDKNGGSGSSKVKVISGNSNVVVIGDDGYYYTTSSGNESSAQTEIILNTEKDGGDSNHNEVKVIVLRSITVNDLSDADKLKIRNGVNSETVPFSNLKIYPNPVASTLMLSYSSSSTEPLQITIYDENGKIVYTEMVNETGGQVNKSISLSGYAPGIYFVNLLQGNQQETKKIIVGK
jgi:hypothetical protein